ncbi:MAG: glycoside hydrolase family 3 protein [Chloroflexota bacterium]
MRDGEHLKTKCYQLVISRLDGDKILSQAYRAAIIRLAEKGIGGFILFGGERERIREFINTVQSVSKTPLFIASDIERGVGQQVAHTTTFPCQMAVAAATALKVPESVMAVEEMVRALAAEARDVGINMPLIPVMDVNQAPDNPIICTRAFSDDPEVVGWLGSLYIRTLEREGLISCAKHFPGHGDTETDSHLSLPVIRKPMRELLRTDLLPFVKAIEEDVGSIMVGHLLIPALDDAPATVSRKVMTKLLREELRYKGLVLTDALNMGALGGITDLFPSCVAAGADILLHPSDPKEAAEALAGAVRSGRLAEERIDDALTRIANAKKRLTLTERPRADYGKNQLCSEKITERSLTLVKHGGRLLPLSRSDKVTLVIAGDEAVAETCVLPRLLPGITGTTLLSPKERGAVISPVPAEGIVLIAIFTAVSAWKGRSGISREEKERVQEIVRRARRSIVASFGSPYVLEHFPDADAAIAVYDTSEQAQSALEKGLYGTTAFTGKIPVRI